MNRLGKTIFVTLILTTLVGAVSASPAELNIFPEQSSTEINSFTSYEIELHNAGPVADVYYLSSPSSEVTLAPTRVPETGNLEPGETETVNVWYNPAEDKEAGVHSFDINARSRASGEVYSTSAQVEVIKDHQVSVNVADSKTGCVGEQVTYEVDVTNDGIQSESFKLTTRYGELSQNEVSLQPDETQTVTLVASADEEVQENFNVIAASQSSYAQDIQNVQFNTEICYDSDVSITPENKSVSAHTQDSFEVTVQNTGTRDDSFTLTSNVGEFEDTELEVEGQSSATTTLNVQPEELGGQTVEVSAEGRSTSEATATMNVVNGMDVSTEFGYNSYSVCEAQQFELGANITNTGAAEESYSLQTNIGNLSEDQITLEQGETQTVVVGADSESLERGTHGINLTAQALTFGEPSSTSSANIDVENCYDLEMNAVPKVASAGENRSVIYEVFLNNTGTQENTYELSHEGPDWVSIQPAEVTVAPGETGKSFMYAGIPFQKEGEVEITAQAVGTQVTKSQSVKLLIGEEVQDAIESGEDNGPTGGFADRLPTGKVDLGSNTGKIAASLIIGLLITAGVLYREW